MAAPPSVAPRRSAAATPPGAAPQPPAAPHRAAAGVRGGRVRGRDRARLAPRAVGAPGGRALRRGVGARRLRDDALAADGEGPRRVPAAPLHAAPTSAPPTPRRCPAVRTSRPRVRDGGEVDVDVTYATRIFGAISNRLTLAVEEDERTARRASPGARSRCSRACAPASGSSARRRCRRAPRSRPATARSSRTGEAAPVRPRPDRVGDRRPARPRAARARGGAGPPRRPRRHAGRAQRARAHLRRAAGRHARAAR